MKFINYFVILLFYFKVLPVEGECPFKRCSSIQRFWNVQVDINNVKGGRGFKVESLTGKYVDHIVFKVNRNKRFNLVTHGHHQLHERGDNAVEDCVRVTSIVDKASGIPMLLELLFLDRDKCRAYDYYLYTKLGIWLYVDPLAFGRKWKSLKTNDPSIEVFKGVVPDD